MDALPLVLIITGIAFFILAIILAFSSSGHPAFVLAGILPLICLIAGVGLAANGQRSANEVRKTAEDIVKIEAMSWSFQKRYLTSSSEIREVSTSLSDQLKTFDVASITVSDSTAKIELEKKPASVSITLMNGKVENVECKSMDNKCPKLPDLSSDRAEQNSSDLTQ